MLHRASASKQKKYQLDNLHYFCSKMLELPVEEGRHVVRFPSPLLSMIVGVEMSVLEATHRKTKGLALPGEQAAAVCCTEPCCSCSTYC